MPLQVSDDLEWVLGSDPAYNTVFIEKAMATIALALTTIEPVTVAAARAIVRAQ